MEAEACHALGVAQHALGEHAAAVRHHRAELELAHRLGLTHLQVSSATIYIIYKHIHAHNLVSLPRPYQVLQSNHIHLSMNLSPVKVKSILGKVFNA